MVLQTSKNEGTAPPGQQWLMGLIYYKQIAPMGQGIVLLFILRKQIAPVGRYILALSNNIANNTFYVLSK